MAEVAEDDEQTTQCRSMLPGRLQLGQQVWWRGVESGRVHGEATNGNVHSTLCVRFREGLFDVKMGALALRPHVAKACDDTILSQSISAHASVDVRSAIQSCLFIVIQP